MCKCRVNIAIARKWLLSRRMIQPRMAAAAPIARWIFGIVTARCARAAHFLLLRRTFDLERRSSNQKRRVPMNDETDLPAESRRSRLTVNARAKTPRAARTLRD